MPAVPVIYRQALTGERLRHYGPWAKHLPLPLLQRLSRHLPERELWQARLPCGDRESELLVLGNPKGVAAPLDREGQAARPVVYSQNLAAVQGAAKPTGQSLALSLLRRILPDLARQLALYGDQLAVALAVAPWERAFWVLGLEPYARRITVFLGENEAARPLGQAGLAVRSASYSSGRVDAHLLVVSPQCLPAVKRLALRQGTLLISTSGLALAPFLGGLSLEIALPRQLGLPAEIWAEENDQFPVLETALIAAYQAGRLIDWPVNLGRRIVLMDRVYAWSDWPLGYRLLSEGKTPAGGE